MRMHKLNKGLAIDEANIWMVRINKKAKEIRLLFESEENNLLSC